MTDRILVIGASGVFGSRVVRLLEAEGFTVIRAGRSGPEVLDRNSADFAAWIAALAPVVVIDAAGPFQSYGDDPWRVAKAALGAGAHYIDLSDDAGFTAGIANLDAEAKARGLTCLSGVSSVPALSSAVVEELVKGLSRIDLISTAILPGNRAPRGLSLMRAVLAQAGKKLRLWRGGDWDSLHGWGAGESFTVTVQGRILTRRGSVIGAPDLWLFPDRYGAATVEFRAGLELGLLHQGLFLLSLLVRGRLLRSLEPLARPLRWIAARLDGFGTDKGAMVVRLIGQGAQGPVERRWMLIAEGGDGPLIPAIPALIVTRAVLAGRLATGARAALGEFTLAGAEAELHRFAIVTGKSETPFARVFETALGSDVFATLPDAVADLHDVRAVRRFEGKAQVTRGTAPAARLAARLMGLPPAADSVEVRVMMERRGLTEVWTRQFAERRFHSVLKARTSGGITERFGALSFDVDLRVDANGLHYPVIGGRILGIPLPRVLLPQSTSREFTDDRGCANFDVSLSHPWCGLIVRYQGWLAPRESVPPQTG